jgi:hypothetical protein
MVICPIALAVHCTGCPLVKICPVKKIVGDYGKIPAEHEDEPKPDGKDDDPPKKSQR